MGNYDLTGKTIVITGATSGIGLDAEVTLANSGAFLIGIRRSEKRNKAAMAYHIGSGGYAGKAVNPLMFLQKQYYSLLLKIKSIFLMAIISKIAHLLSPVYKPGMVN